MKRYILLMSCLLVAALVLSVLVYYLVAQYQRTLPVVGEVATQRTATTATSTSVLPGEVGSTRVDAPTTSAPVYETIPLRDMSLTPTQATALEFIGMDQETAEITPAMQACAVERLGEARIAEIIAGDTPTVGELWQLKGCL